MKHTRTSRRRQAHEDSRPSSCLDPRWHVHQSHELTEEFERWLLGVEQLDHIACSDGSHVPVLSDGWSEISVPGTICAFQCQMLCSCQFVAMAGAL